MRREFHISRLGFWWHTPDDKGGFWTTAIHFWPIVLSVEYMSAKSRRFYRARAMEWDTPKYWEERAAAIEDDTRWVWPRRYRV